MSGVLHLIAISVLLLWMSFSFSGDEVQCTVKLASGPHATALTGYYQATAGIYRKQTYSSYFIPDVFDYFSIRPWLLYAQDSRIVFLDGNWLLVSRSNKQPQPEILFKASSKVGDHVYIHYPPRTGWMAVSPLSEAVPEVVNCVGKLEDAPADYDGSNSNLAKLWEHPVTTTVLIILTYYGYHLWANRIDASAVAFSYDTVVQQGEYWRMFTASIAHVDLWHFGFNTMTLYQLGILEPVYGSLTFAYLSIALIFITVLITLLIYFIGIYKYGRQDFLYQSAIGYSAVLFAWMVAESVRQEEYCPIFLFPSFCVKTWLIPFPEFVHSWLGLGLPVNLGPFILLVITKFIIPRSSFVGHLSGILIGYPLAWNALNWLTPPIAIASVGLLWTTLSKKYVWLMPAYDVSTANLADYVSPDIVRNYRLFTYLSYAMMLVSVPAAYFSGLLQVYIRAIAVFFLWSAVQARKIDYYTTLSNIQQDCANIILFTIAFVTLLWLCDFASLIVAWHVESFLEGNSLSASYLLANKTYYLILVSLETVYIILGIIVANDMAACVPLLSKFGFDRSSILQDLRRLRLIGAHPQVTPFTGSSYRLNSSEERAPLASTSTNANESTVDNEDDGVELGERGASANTNTTGGSGSRKEESSKSKLLAKFSTATIAAPPNQKINTQPTTKSLDI